MKRLLGLIGLTYLSVLTVVYYFYIPYLLCAILVISCSSACVCIGLILFKKYIKLSDKIKYACKVMLILALSSACACVNIIFYTNTVCKPVVDNYSDKEIKISGYICDEIIFTDESSSCTIETYSVNGKSEKLKIQLISYKDLRLEAFDRIDAVMTVYSTDNDSLLSKGIFLKSYVGDNFKFSKTGEKHSNLYSKAVEIRCAMKESVDCLLAEDYSALCKAVLLGDKMAIPYDVKQDFSNTGASFLIVVSGMHLSIVAGFALFFIKNITNNRFLLAAIIFIISFSYMAITGFYPSTVRAGVMIIITYCAKAFMSRADSLNSLGAAALVLTFYNPYAVGDKGLLLSFSATAGIILWSYHINKYLVSTLKIKKILGVYIVNMFSVSLAASIWIIPVTMICFHKITVINVLVSVILGPIISLLIICAMIAAILFLIPLISFLAYPFALAAGLLSKLTLFLIRLFASIPFSSLNTDKIYFYIWLGVTAFLVVLGFIIKPSPKYIKKSIAISIFTLVSGYAIFSLVAADNEIVTIYNVDNGVSVSVSDGIRATVLSCGGSKRQCENVCKNLSKDYSLLEYIVVPNQKYLYSKYIPFIVNEFDTSSIFVYDKDSEQQRLADDYDGNNRIVFGENVHFKLNISDNISDDLINIDGATFQFVKGSSKSLLFIAGEADISKLPVEYRTADYLLIDKIPNNIELLDFDTLIFSADKKNYNKNYNELNKLNCSLINTLEENIVIDLK